MSRQFKKLGKDTQWVVIFFCAIFNVLLWMHIVNEVIATPINATQGTIDNVPIGQTTPSDGNFTFISSTHGSLSGMLSVAGLRIGSLTTQTGAQSAAGDMLGFIGTGQPSFVKSGPTGYVLKSGGAGIMPRWEAESGGAGSPDWTNPGTIGSSTPNTGKFTSLESTTGLTVDVGGIVSKDTVAAGGSGIVGYADSGVAISSGDRLGYYFLGGAKDNAHSMDNSAGMSAYATQNWNGSAAGTKLQFEVTPNGSTTRSTAVTIDQDNTAIFHGVVAGSVSIGGRVLNAWSPAPNLLVNSEFIGDVHPSQVGNTACGGNNCARSDDSYNIDMWNYYATGAGYNYVGTTSNSNSGTFRWMAAHANAGSSKIGLVQIVENALTVPLQGQRVSLSFSAEYLTSNLSSGGVTGGILCSTATADAPNAVYAANSVPTLGTAWTLVASVNTGLLNSTWTTYYLENVSIPNNCNNIAVSFWNPSAENSGTIWQIANPKLEVGTASTPYAPNNAGVALALLRRYLLPMENGIMIRANTASTAYASIQHPVTMRCANAILTMPSLSFSAYADPDLAALNAVATSAVVSAQNATATTFAINTSSAYTANKWYTLGSIVGFAGNAYTTKLYLSCEM